MCPYQAILNTRPSLPLYKIKQLLKNKLKNKTAYYIRIFEAQIYMLGTLNSFKKQVLLFLLGTILAKQNLSIHL